VTQSDRNVYAKQMCAQQCVRKMLTSWDHLCILYPSMSTCSPLDQSRSRDLERGYFFLEPHPC
jgi:hypothetical protein